MRTFFLLLFVTTLVYFKPGPDAAFDISGHIEGIKGDTLFIYATSIDESYTDTLKAVVRQGNFNIKGNTEGPKLASIVMGRSRIAAFILEKGIIKISGTVDNVIVTGTPENDVMRSLHETVRNRRMRIRGLSKTIAATQDSDTVKLLRQRMQLMEDSLINDQAAFVEAHPGSLNSAGILYVLSSAIPLEKLQSLYNGLHENVKKTSYIRFVEEAIAGLNRTKVGNIAPSFDIIDVNGLPVSLEAYKGKYVLLEFWASWCVPCRQQIPSLKRAYEKYKDKGFTILGISVDASKEKWLKALEEEKLPWTNVRDTPAVDNSIAKLYGVVPIPDNFLIGPDGRILDKKIHGDVLEKKLGSFLNSPD